MTRQVQIQEVEADESQENASPKMATKLPFCTWRRCAIITVASGVLIMIALAGLYVWFTQGGGGPSIKTVNGSPFEQLEVGSIAGT